MYKQLKALSCRWLILTLLVISFQYPADAKDRKIEVKYQLQWGNLDIAEMEASWTFTETSFEMTGEARSRGALSAFREFSGLTYTRGAIKNNEFFPEMIDVRSLRKGQTRHATTRWNSAAELISTTRNPELNLDEVHPIEDEFLANSIDPLTAMLRSLATVERKDKCSGSYQIYDGLRASTVTLHDFGKEEIKADRPSAFSGNVWRCGIISKPTGGHRLKSRWRKKNPQKDDVVVFLGTVDNQILPVRIEIKTMLGKLITRLVM